MGYFASELGAWAVLGTFLMAFATAATFFSHLLRVKRSNVWETVEDWKKNAEASEARSQSLEREIGQLRVLADDSRKEVFNMSVLVADLKRENVRLGLRELDQQRQIDTLTKRIKQFSKTIEQLGGTVPEPREEEF